jgi:Zn-dependent peptidase ImmA (M78 family)/DNA-binding XRE family transcriptional regulator
MANLADVTPSVLTWARKAQKLSAADLAAKVGVHENQITKWELSKTKPTFNQAQDLAQHLRIPFGYLFLSEPPKLEDPLPDLRTRQNRRPKRISANLREVVYGVLDIQDWYREYRLEYEAAELPFVASMTIDDDPKVVAESIRARLSLTPALRESVNAPSKYLTALVDTAERAGILVMQSGVVGNNNTRSLSVDEFQGFVAVDRYAPVMFINTRDYVNARIFTFAHELAHIWIGTSGVLNPDEAEIASPKTNLETFCNSIAAEVLVPKDEFLAVFSLLEGSMSQLANHFKVSQLVILRRLFELNKIELPEFSRRLHGLLKMLKPKKSRGGGVNYPELVSWRHSTTFMDSVIKDVRSGGTMIRDAARLLHMETPTFHRIAEVGEY